MPRLVLHRRAAHHFERLNERIKSQLREKLNGLVAELFAAAGVKPRHGEWKRFFRLRHGDLRVIYTVDKERDLLLVAHIGSRGDVYK
jgi:mRNA interferase RelE/StbE